LKWFISIIVDANRPCTTNWAIPWHWCTWICLSQFSTLTSWVDLGFQYYNGKSEKTSGPFFWATKVSGPYPHSKAHKEWTIWAMWAISIRFLKAHRGGPCVEREQEGLCGPIKKVHSMMIDFLWYLLLPSIKAKAFPFFNFYFIFYTLHWILLFQPHHEMPETFLKDHNHSPFLSTHPKKEKKKKPSLSLWSPSTSTLGIWKILGPHFSLLATWYTCTHLGPVYIY
jgi:hypothetical protein